MTERMPTNTPIADRLDSLADRLGLVHMLLARELREIVRDVVRMERNLPKQRLDNKGSDQK